MSIRIVHNQQQLQNAINTILNFIQQYPQGKSWDFSGNRITNAGPSVNSGDYITRGELAGLVAPLIAQAPTAVAPNFYTAVFTPPDGVSDGTLSPVFTIGIGRSGIPNQAWLSCTGAPSNGNLTANILYNGNPILQANLEIPQGSTSTQNSSTFVIPVPTFAQNGSLQLQIVTSGGATGISGGLVVQVIAKS